MLVSDRDRRWHWIVGEVISELNLALAECRAHIAHRIKDNQTLEHLAEAAREIERALKPLKAIE
jgi:hypothetical protein